MTMNEKICDFVDNYGNAFIVGSLITKKQIYMNKTAKTLFGVSLDNCDFSKIFDRTELRLNEVIQTSLESNQTCNIYNVPANKADGGKILVDIQLGFFNKESTEIFLEIIPYNEKTELIALNQIDNSIRAEAILENDDKLSIYHCNQKFCNMLGYDTIQQLEKNLDEAIQILPMDKKQKLIKEMKECFDRGQDYSKEIRIFSIKKGEKWVLLELQKRKITSSEEKIMCFVTNIEKTKQTESKLNTFSKYFTAMQSLSNESLYTIDVKTRILR